MLEILIERIEFVGEYFVDTATWIQAYRLCHDIDENDIPFIALTLQLNGVLWTGDNILKQGLQKKGFAQFYNSPGELTNDKIRDYLKKPASITGKEFVHDVQVNTNQHLTIEYYYDYDEYVKNNPETGVSKILFENYFGTGDKVSKLLIAEPIRLLRNIPQLKSIEIIVPYQAFFYEVLISRRQAEEYFKLSFDDLKNSEKWRTMFVDEFVYNANRQQKFIEEFARKKQ